MVAVPRERRPTPLVVPDVPSPGLAEHLVDYHGIPREYVGTAGRGWSRWALELQHAADHAQRPVGHVHG